MNNSEKSIGNKLIPLAPTINKVPEVYIESLSRALTDDTIFNVALSGSFGSGKSSILKTFINKKKGTYHFIEVSLASFTSSKISDNASDNGKDSTSNSDKNGTNLKTDNSSINILVASNNVSSKNAETISAEQLRLIELSILQQIFYSVDPINIPLSSFKRKYNIDKIDLKIYASLALLGIFGTLFFLRPSFISIPSFWKELFLEKEKNLFLPAIFSVLFALWPALKWLFKMVQLSKISTKIKIANAEFGLEDKQETSLLNKHIDELIYIFENTRCDAVIIEDLDRFGNPDIFTKLREINRLINLSIKSKPSCINRSVKFIYAIKDDMFSDFTRTKFFDLIIPVIPVVDFNNSYDQALALNDAYSLGISKELLGTIALYVNEIRLLNNIFNEYLIYQSALNFPVRNDKLFSLIAYKNMYPKDFAALSNKDGILYEVFEITKKIIVDAETKHIENQIQLHRNQIEKIKNELIDSKNVLVAQYVKVLFDFFDNAHEICVDDEFYKIRDIDSKLLSKWSENNSEINGYYYQKSYSSYYKEKSNKSLSFHKIENELLSNDRFEIRIKLIESKNSNKIDELESEITKLDKKIIAIRHKNLSFFLFGVSHYHLLNNKFRDSGLLFNLVRGGYIDETYTYDLSFFNPKSMTYLEREYVINVIGIKTNDFFIKIEHPEKVTELLNPNYFSSTSIFNIDLIDYLVVHEHKHYELKIVFSVIASKEEITISFLKNYFIYGKKREVFVSLLAEYWNSFWAFIKNESNFDKDMISEIFGFMLSNCDAEILFSQNSNNVLSDYISSNPTFFDVYNETSVPYLFDKLIKLKVKFKNISLIKQQDEKKRLIYNNCLYEINGDNITFYLKLYNAGLSDKVVLESNYTTILNSGLDVMINYVNENVSTYIENVFLSLKTNSNEDVNVIVKLLNIDSIDVVVKEKILLSQKNKISKIDEVNKSCWDILFKTKKLIATWDNLNVYYNHCKSVGIKVDYFNEFLNTTYTYIELQNDFPDNDNLNYFRHRGDSAIPFITDVIENYDLSPDCFIEFLKICSIKLNDKINFSKISEDNIKSLIITNTIGLTPFNYAALKIVRFHKLHIFLLAHNIEFYFKGGILLEISLHDTILILESDFVSLENKNIIINKINHKYIENSSLLTSKCTEIVIEALKQNLILNLSTEVINNIINSLINYNLLHSDNYREILRLLGDPYIALLRAKGRSAKLPLTDFNKKILDQLILAKIVSTYKEKDGHLQVYLKHNKTTEG